MAPATDIETPPAPATGETGATDLAASQPKYLAAPTTASALRRERNPPAEPPPPPPVVAIYMLTTSLKGQSSMKLHRDLEITQKTAWFLAHRIRQTFAATNGPFAGPVEVDETYVGGRRANMSNAKGKELAGTGRGAVGKTAVVGAKDRARSTWRPVWCPTLPKTPSRGSSPSTQVPRSHRLHR